MTAATSGRAPARRSPPSWMIADPHQRHLGEECPAGDPAPGDVGHGADQVVVGSSRPRAPAFGKQRVVARVGQNARQRVQLDHHRAGRRRRSARRCGTSPGSPSAW
ncbi:MAG: hypothetical protein MZV64_30205 [Ignavibacteriales bacterium]|nr:hypothetical protein [Ignavibacteriales bacterium]